MWFGSAKPADPQPGPSARPEGLQPGVEKMLGSLTFEQQTLIIALHSEKMNQSHLFANWDEDGVSPAVKRKFIEELTDVHRNTPGGLEGYINNAQKLLADSKVGRNPLDGWVPAVPKGKSFEIGSDEFEEMEALGKEDLGRVGFVLVAGGLGERLGYSKIKVGLPTELATETCYLEYYIEYILAVQDRFAAKGTRLPLCIMTSADTNNMTVNLLKKNQNFGMEKGQITIVQQGDGVPALMDNDARLALDPKDPYRLVKKPHGHGDIHYLLYYGGVITDWLGKGIEWISFFQDTNGLAFHTLPLALGVSKSMNLIMNSMTVPRKAKQAIGAIAKLTNTETGEERTINVEYNQLDPLLRATEEFKDGDVNDPTTGYSVFPGNINQILFQAHAYNEALERTKGYVPEFVNPKYKDETKTEFKKPTRLECMMQDFPTMLNDEDAQSVGFTNCPAEICFSPCKNATTDGVKLQEKGTHPQCAASAEADQYGAFRLMMKALGVNVEEGDDETYQGVTVKLSPEIVIKPESALCFSDLKEIFPEPSKVTIAKNASLVIQGAGKLVIQELKLEGAAVIDCQEGAEATLSNMWVENAGWKRVAMEEGDDEVDEVTAMRGYTLEKKETENLEYQASKCNIQ